MKPTKGVSNENLKDSSREFVSPTESSSSSEVAAKAVVFLIGWTGCEERHLAKYGSFYEEKGFDVIRYSPAAKLMFGFDPERDLTRHARRLIAVLKERRLETRPLWFHSFSNGGAVVYYLISKELDKAENAGIRVAGTVFDSSPARMTNRTTLNAISSVVPGNALKKYSFGAAAITFLWLSYGINKFRDLFTGAATEDYRLWVYYTLKKQRNLSPQLFLYSRGDKIADWRSVESFVESRTRLGVTTDRRVWDDSPHVSHFKFHPEEYGDQLNQFLTKCGLDPGRNVAVPAGSAKSGQLAHIGKGLPDESPAELSDVGQLSRRPSSSYVEY